MDELEYKLNSNNAILIARTISSLVETIQQKQTNNDSKKSNKNELKQLKYLREKCVSSNSLVSLTAAKGLVFLVESGLLQASSTISELISSLTNAGSYSGLVYAVGELLIIELKKKLKELQSNQSYECQYNLRVPQHPLISILLHNSQTWMPIFGQIKNLGNCDDEMVFLNKNRLLRPFYLYALCDYDSKVAPVFRQQLWSYLTPTLLKQDPSLFSEIISWMRLLDKDRILEMNNFIIECMDILLTNEDTFLEIIIIYLAYVLHAAISKNIDPNTTIQCITKIVSEKPNLNCINCLLLMLADTICVCPSIYVYDLLNYCDLLLSSNRCNNLIVKSVKASCLQWMLQSCLLTSHCTDIIKKIINYNPQTDVSNLASSEELESNPAFRYVLNTNETIHLVKEICILAETISEEELLNWLEQMEKAPQALVKRICSFLLGLLMFSFKNKEIFLKVLNILTLCSEKYHEITSNLMTVILFKLSNTTDPVEHFHLLKALPKMGVLKENLPLVVSTLQVLASGGELKLRTFALRLFYDLWTLQVRCYPLLQNLLVQNQVKDEWEIYTTKAYILMKLCEKRPELYGTELAAHLSKVLNKCKTPDGSLASSFALQGLKYLCKEGIVDIATAWTTLEPSFSSENRPVVLQSLCDLLTEVATLPENDKYDSLIYEITGRLWKFATYHPAVEVNIAAYKALGFFTLEQISAHVMDIIEDSESIPDNFGHIPGISWLALLQNSNYASMNAAGDLIIKLTSSEISGYLKGTYHIGEGRREPTNFNSLPNYSIVRALGNYVKQNVEKFENETISKEVYLECLRILSQEYCKPFPPVDWCFLQELVHIPSARAYCISIASHQVVLSGTARRFMENFIVTVTNVTNNDDDIAFIYKNLKYLANSIQPMLMKPFFENTFRYIMEKEDCTELLEILVDSVKSILKINDIQDANKSVILAVIMDHMKQIDPDHKTFSKCVNCFTALPQKYLKEIASLASSSEMTPQQIQMAINIRCVASLERTETPFSLLDEALNVINVIPGEQNYFLVQLVEVFGKHKGHVSTVAWLLEFLGQIQVNLADDRYRDIKEMLFLCDVFMMAVIIFSGHDVFGDVKLQNVRFRLFPLALADLVKSKDWNHCTSQILEWLLYMANYQNVPTSYKKIFSYSLVSLKNEDVFSDSFRWMKYVGTFVKE